ITTDGNPTDEGARTVEMALTDLRQQVEAHNGVLIVTVIRLSDAKPGAKPGPSKILANDDDAAQMDPLGQRCYRWASRVPKDVALVWGVAPETRLMGNNVSPADFTEMLKRGSTAAAKK